MTAHLHCTVCGAMPVDASLSQELARFDLPPVCSECADIVANLYSFARSGKYMNWEDQPVLAGGSSGPGHGLAVALGKNRKKIGGETRRLVMERDQYRCRACGSWKRLCIDHVVPLSKGGTDEPGNLQTLCWDCNTEKGAKLPEGTP